MSRKVFRRGVTDTSTTLSDLGEIGDKRFEDGKTYRLVYCATTQANDAILYLDSVDTSLASYQVQVAVTDEDYPFCVNDTGATIASGTYFWGQAEGPWAAEYTAFSTKADIATENPLYMDADGKLGTTIASDSTPAVGQSIVSLTSVATNLDDAGPYTVYIKMLGA